ncbi:RidA family protein [Sabulicella rubraurantiaca]|uniref:RidA family protein n=1 Tax=Sabulicella rubraurantiaca TaxID=2811429 RepID=UPI001A9688CE|nr:RidA family protein [Sabulicella rubraurantiaca]
MAEIEQKLSAMGLELPDPIMLPPGVKLGIRWVRVLGDRAFVSGHAPLAQDGSLAYPLGRVGVEVTQDEAYNAARLAALAMLASLKSALGDLDRIMAWLRVFGMVNTGGQFNAYPLVINGFTDLIVEVFGPERGQHARSAVGMAGLPFNIPILIEAEVLIRSSP